MINAAYVLSARTNETTAWWNWATTHWPQGEPRLIERGSKATSL